MATKNQIDGDSLIERLKDLGLGVDEKLLKIMMLTKSGF